MSHRFTLGVITGILALLVAGFAGAYLMVTNGMLPANADAKPGRLETWAAKKSLNAAIARDMPRSPNPVAQTTFNFTEGIKLYGANCAVCHGVASGERTNIAKGFYQVAPQLAKKGVEDDPAGITYWKITHGIRFTAMPAFSKTLTDSQRWQITLLLEHMDKLP
ncbi:MAG: cytochrome c, partial [Candidatus Eremiobacteraeota bacterium]|nr:cytochrome c [Candidatus Eremiobacteraeota bacterium]